MTKLIVYTISIIYGVERVAYRDVEIISCCDEGSERMFGESQMVREQGKRLITSTEVVNRCKISYQTLNYYTNLGLVNAEGKVGNKRLYSAKSIEDDLKKIWELKQQGYPLRLIRKLLVQNNSGSSF